MANIKITKKNIDDLRSKDYRFYITGIRRRQPKKAIKEALELGATSLYAVKR